MYLIGITGKAGSGKDTVAQYLSKTYTMHRYSMAQPLKAMLRVLGIDCDDRFTKETPHPMFGVSPRRMMQTLGTEWMRASICRDGWLKLAEQRRQEGEQEDLHGIVIPDIRFEDEAAWVRAKGGAIVHLYRPSLAPVEEHSSEHGVRYEVGQRDYGVVNGSTVEDLCRQVDVFMRSVQQRQSKAQEAGAA